MKHLDFLPSAVDMSLPLPSLPTDLAPWRHDEEQTGSVVRPLFGLDFLHLAWQSWSASEPIGSVTYRLPRRFLNAAQMVEALQAAVAALWFERPDVAAEAVKRRSDE